MLLSTNSSRIVDISHENELRRGLKTSGEKQDEDSDEKSTAQKIKEGAKEMKDDLKADVNRAGDKMYESTDRALGKMQDMSDRSKDKMNRMGESIYEGTDRALGKMQDMSERSKGSINRTIDRIEEKAESASDKVQQMSDRTKGRMSRAKPYDMEDMSQRTKESMERVGNVDRVLNDAEAANTRMQARSSSSDTMEGNVDRGQQNEDFDIDNKSDMYERALRDAAKMNPADSQDRSSRRIGTEDNFDDDPAISINDMEDKIREAKRKITGGIDHPVENMRKSMMETTQGIKETVKGLTDAAKSTVQEATTKTKEFLTGEREEEKPDETESEVRTAPPKPFPPGSNKSSQPGSSE
jgi:uncharacterized phage infection (PIP) family protein YhgE